MKTKIADLKQKLTHGVTPAMATPLTADGYHVNTAVIPQLVNFLAERGVSGLFAGGTTGQGILLDVAERRRLHEATVAAANGRLPVILHVGANRLDTAVSLAHHAAELEADAIAAVTPAYYSIHDNGLAAYYHALASAAPETPLLLYDIPHMAINGIGPALLARLADALPTVAGVKTSRPDAQIVRQLLDAAPPHLIVLAGNERVALGLLALGADGLISGLSTAVPEPFVALTRAFARGEVEAARQQQRLINQLVSLLPGGARIGGVKQILAERGVAVGTAVPPQPMPTEPIWPRMEPLITAST